MKVSSTDRKHVKTAGEIDLTSFLDGADFNGKHAQNWLVHELKKIEQIKDAYFLCGALFVKINLGYLPEDQIQPVTNTIMEEVMRCVESVAPLSVSS